MTSVDAGGSVGSSSDGWSVRLVAALLAVVLGAATLVGVPRPAVAATDTAPVTITFEQTRPWWHHGYKWFRATVTGPGGVPVDGTASFVVDGVSAGSWTEPVELVRERTIARDLEPGTHEVRISFQPSSGGEPVEATFDAVVGAGTVPATVTHTSVPDVPYGHSVMVDVEVTAASSTPVGGRVVLLRDGVVAGWPDSVEDGRARLNIRAASELGTHTYVIGYHGTDGVMSARSQPFQVRTVKDKVPIRASVNGSWGPLGGWIFVEVEGHSLWDEKGTLAVYEGSRKLSHRVQELGDDVSLGLPKSALTHGRHTLTVRLTDHPNIADTSTTVAVNVVRYDVGMWTSQTSGWRWGGTPRLQVNVHPESNVGDFPVRTGTVTVYRGKTKLGSAKLGGRGTAVVKLRSMVMQGGKHRLRVVYSGDRHFAGRTEYETVRVHTRKAVFKARMVDKTVERGKHPKILVTVTSPSGLTMTGTIRVKTNDGTVRKVPLRLKDKGRKVIKLPKNVDDDGWGYATLRFMKSTTGHDADRLSVAFSVR